MSAVENGGPSNLANIHRPYTIGTFQKKLNEFQEFIRDITLQDVDATPEEKRQRITETLRYDQFCESIRTLFGSDVKNNDLKAVYRKISTNPEAKVDWSELFGYFQSGAEEEEITVGEEISVFMVSKRRRIGEAAGDKKRRDTIQCVKYVPCIDSYVSASQKGALCIWNKKLRLHFCTDINEPAWVTGCEYLPGLRRLACCTERSIIIWDNRAKNQSQNLFSIKPIENSPQCITHLPTKAANEDLLMFGDDQGYINLLRLTVKDLTLKNSKGENYSVKQSESVSIEPQKLIHPIVKRKLHDDWVLKVKYFPELRCFGSCSPSSTKSFVLEEVERLYDEIEVRGVSIYKGVNAFDYCVKANIIATGGVDKIIRVWHPHIFSRPTGKLLGHLFTIVDISCNEKDQHLISLSTARVFRVWDIHTLTCLQVFTDNEDRPGEKRIYSMLFDNRNDRLVTGSSVLDAWPLTRTVQDTMQVPHTHDKPINQVLYNKELNQLITICTESVIKVWEIDSGKFVYTITEPHGANMEVTAICLDESGYRLVSGAFDGSLKIWDFGSGQLIKQRAGRGVPDEDYSIVGLSSFKKDEERLILASGWNNKIRLFLDSNEYKDIVIVKEFSDVYYLTREVSLSPSSSDPFKSNPLPRISQNKHTGLASEKASMFRKEYLLNVHEVTCMETDAPDLLITGCLDGTILYWNIDKSVIEKVIDAPQSRDREGSSHRMKQNNGQKINEIRILYHKVRKVCQQSPRNQEGSNAVTDEGRCLTNRSKYQMGASEKKEDDEAGTPMTNTSRTTKSVKISDDNEKGDAEKGEGDSNSEVTDDIIENFDPVIVTLHQDSFIRLWSIAGELLTEITAMTRRQGSAVTALCHDEDCNILITGDQKGYLTYWDIGTFLENQDSTDTNMINQVVCWRAHLMKIVTLAYVDSYEAIISGSTDGSVRIWHGSKANFIGFFGQHKSLVYPSTDNSITSNPSLPYDINEGPLAPVKNSESAKQKLNTKQRFEYPLIFNEDSWTPFKRSAYKRRKEINIEPEDKKFFTALIKPRAYNHHLESSRTAEQGQGAVFRSLPIYSVTTIEKPKTPECSFRPVQDDKATRPQNRTKDSDKPSNKSNKKNVGHTSGMNTSRSSFDQTSGTTSSFTTPRKK